MNLARSAIVGVGLLLGASAPAAELSVLVTDSHSATIADAVVSLRGEHDQPLRAVPSPITKIIDQRGEAFIPYVEIFRPGDQVVFHNSDRTRHHVYSFAPAKSFEFVIGSGRSAPPVTLDQIGEIAVGCNIHDRMIAHLYVSDAPHVAKSGLDGRVVFDDLPTGAYSVQVWHPQLRPGRTEPPRAAILESTPVNLTIALSLLPDPRAGADDPERSKY